MSVLRTAFLGLLGVAIVAHLVLDSTPEAKARREAAAAEAARQAALPAYLKGSESDRHYEACVIAQHYVKAYLKAPSTAKFESCLDARGRQDGSGYTVQTSVDAQNSFGAMLRSTYQGKLSGTGQQWVPSGGIQHVR